ncbi:MAG: hypothetical protein GX625_06690 [Clostridiaceae bacterium]|nr:hypothetical protein [Clostridiaceae bacterium]
MGLIKLLLAQQGVFWPTNGKNAFKNVSKAHTIKEPSNWQMNKATLKPVWILRMQR